MTKSHSPTSPSPAQSSSSRASAPHLNANETPGHIVLEISAAPPSSHDDDNDERNNGQTTPTPTEALQPSASFGDQLESTSTALLSSQHTQLPPRTYHTIPKEKKIAERGVVQYKASIGDFKAPGDYITLWSVSVPACYRIEERTRATLKLSGESHLVSFMEVSGSWEEMKENKYEQQEQKSK
ncbi:hypothetical protein BGZ83_007114 [Gryganskiella cystojenkinii]|nr:hypothetical protein BGZ83_007114 [Gryganskiella cystojenkinii]